MVEDFRKCRPVINKPPPFKGLKDRIPIIVPIKVTGFINHGSAYRVLLGVSISGVQGVLGPGGLGFYLDSGDTAVEEDIIMMENQMVSQMAA